MPLHFWFQAAFLMASSEKGVSSNQLHRTLGVTLKTAWFMSMRLREAMRVLKIEPIGGTGKFVEADETYVGGKARNRAYREPPPKEAVMALVERGGRVASHVSNVTAATLKPIIAEVLSTNSHFRTDESGVYWKWANSSPVIQPLSILLTNTFAATHTLTLLKDISRS